MTNNLILYELGVNTQNVNAINQWRMTHFKPIPDTNIHMHFYQFKTPAEISVKLDVDTYTVKYIIKQFKQILRRRA